ncbi:molecular chaperone DnaK, partial [Streptomyces chitinivorans]|nr:molecular chaperone DnaK [Streptomyces chitinivorans]
DTAAIREASEKVAATSQKLGQALYADAQGQQAAGGAEAGAGARTGGADDDVVDAEIVDDDKPKGDAA